MWRFLSRKNCEGYTLLKELLTNLELNKRDYTWLITYIDVYSKRAEINDLLMDKEYVILSTKELMAILEKENFKWIWAVFSGIPSKCTKEEILKYELPLIEPRSSEDDSYIENLDIQHPLAEIEINVWDNSGMFMTTEDESIITKFKTHYPFFEEMAKHKVIFDDWDVREKGIYQSRKKQYSICFTGIIILNIILIIAAFFEWYFCFMLVISLIGMLWMVLEWLKVKNNHLVITQDAIYITNRFKKEFGYKIYYKKCKLEIKSSVKRGGGLFLKFYDSNDKLICKYEDMLNYVSGYKEKSTKWEKAVKSLNIPIIDKNEVFKN